MFWALEPMRTLRGLWYRFHWVRVEHNPEGTWWDRLHETLWSILPDKCVMPGCERQGIRGNENRIVYDGRWQPVCDYCSVQSRVAKEK